jgi:hypothetical protein
LAGLAVLPAWGGYRCFAGRGRCCPIRQPGGSVGDDPIAGVLSARTQSASQLAALFPPVSTALVGGRGGLEQASQKGWHVHLAGDRLYYYFVRLIRSARANNTPSMVEIQLKHCVSVAYNFKPVQFTLGMAKTHPPENINIFKSLLQGDKVVLPSSSIPIPSAQHSSANGLGISSAKP